MTYKKFCNCAVLIFFIFLPAELFGSEQFIEVCFNPRLTYVNPDSLFLLSIEVSPVDSITAFEIIVDYDETSLEVVSVTEGALFRDSGFSTFWSVLSTDDSIHVDNLILGTGSYVDGPGCLVDITFRAANEGYSILDFKSCNLFRDLEEVPDVRAVDGIVSVSVTAGFEHINIPDDVILDLTSFPNPFSTTTYIQYYSSNRSQAIISIYNSTGKLVRELLRPRRETSVNVLAWDGLDGNGNRVVPGVYYCTLRAGNLHVTKKLVLIR